MGATKQVATSGMIVSVNPATGDVLGEVPNMTGEQVKAAVACARDAQEGWAKLAVVERCERVRQFGRELVSRAEEIIEILVMEAGKNRQEALTTEVVVVADLINYFCDKAPRFLAPEPISLHLVKHRKSKIHYVPRGVIGVIAPWNFPFAIPMGEVVMALIAGNGVVLKPSEFTPLVAIKTKEIFDACGIPPELFQVVTGGGKTGAALIDGGIQYCIFTGSVATGKKVAAACGERLIPCTLELGGKAPAVVCADADLDRTAAAITWGGFANSGQVCCSVERVYAHHAVYDELVSRVVTATKALRQGDPSKQEVDVGAMVWEGQVDHVESMVKTAVTQGATVEVGGTRGKGPGLFYAPTVLSGATQDMDIMREEIFGPVIPIMQVESEAQAVALANDSHLGLVAYVFTQDRAKGDRLAQSIEAGTVMVNDVLTTFGCPETPWGGVKMSGIGRTHSIIGLRDMCEVRHINLDRVSMNREFWWYPYSPKAYRYFLKGLRVLFGKRRFRALFE